VESDDDVTAPSCQGDEVGRLAIGFDSSSGSFALCLKDLQRRPIACIIVDARLLSQAVAEMADASGTVPAIDVEFHVHTLKELIG
jgi:hypothetical protein